MTIIDIGAAGGPHKRWRGSHIIGFEPEKSAFKKLGGIDYRLNTALSDKKSIAEFYILKGRTKSSLLKPNHKFLRRFPDSERFDIEHTVSMSVDTLDNQVVDNHLNTRIDFIKLDTQGSELAILRGSEKTLEHVFGIEIECEFQELYENQPLFGEIDSFLRKFGFRIFDLRPFYWKRNGLGGEKGQLVWAETLYFKDLDFISDPETAVEICLLYGYKDYAAEITDRFKLPKKIKPSLWDSKKQILRGNKLGNE